MSPETFIVGVLAFVLGYAFGREEEGHVRKLESRLVAGHPRLGRGLRWLRAHWSRGLLIVLCLLLLFTMWRLNETRSAQELDAAKRDAQFACVVGQADLLFTRLQDSRETSAAAAAQNDRVWHEFERTLVALLDPTQQGQGQKVIEDLIGSIDHYLALRADVKSQQTAQPIPDPPSKVCGTPVGSETN